MLAGDGTAPDDKVGNDRFSRRTGGRDFISRAPDVANAKCDGDAADGDADSEGNEPNSDSQGSICISHAGDIVEEAATSCRATAIFRVPARPLTFPSHYQEPVLLSRISFAAITAAAFASACVQPKTTAGTSTVTPVLSPWENIPVVDGRSVIRRMRARYDGQFIRTMTFRQLNTLYPVSGGEQKSEWLEYAEIPGKLRIEYLPAVNRNGVLVADGRITAFENGRITRSDPYVHPLMVLLFDVHVLPADSTITLVDSLRINLSLVREDSWQGRRVYVVGAAAGDTTSSQFWVDAERLVTVRLIQMEKRGTRSALSETRMDKFVEFGGVPIATEILFLRDGRHYFREQYTEVRVNEPLAAGLFDAARWSETGAFGGR